MNKNLHHRIQNLDYNPHCIWECCNLVPKRYIHMIKRIVKNIKNHSYLPTIFTVTLKSCDT